MEAYLAIRLRCAENLLFFFLHSVVFSSVVSGKLGALRLKVRLVEDRILPSVYYQPLIHLLVESVISPTEVSITDIHLLTCMRNDVLSCQETAFLSVAFPPEPNPQLSWLHLVH